MKKSKYIWFSFLVPLAIYTLIFASASLFTNKMMINGDSAAQYYPLFHYLKDLLTGSNTLYTLSKGIGGTMFGTIFYYLSSPFNLLLCFIGKSHILNFMTILTIIKLSLCSMTMYIYMTHKFEEKSISIFMFSLLYSFIGYNLNYYLNIMWLDVVLLSPLVLLGIDRIIHQKSPTCYIIFLTLSILSNYYIAYMLCLFCVLYFIHEMVITYKKENKEIIKKLLFRFLISSLLCGFLCAWFLIPCIMEMLNYGRMNSISAIFSFDYNIFNLLATTYMGSTDSLHPFNSTAIQLYCGIMIFPLIFLYFKNKVFMRKQKIITFIVIMMGILPSFIGPLNYVWHLFTLPMGHFYRYSFLFCLFFIVTAYRSYKNLDIKKEDILSYITIYIVYSVIIIYISYFKNYYTFLDYKWIWVTNIFLIIYCFLLYKIKDKAKLNKVLLILILIEICTNTSINILKNQYLNRSEIKDYSELIEKYKQGERIAFRGKSAEEIYNQSFIYNYYSADSFLSTTNYKATHFINTVVGSQDKILNNYSINSTSYIIQSLLGIKTIITEQKLHYPVLEQHDNLTVYNNDNALSLGYIINENCNHLDISFPHDQNVLNCLTGQNNHYYEELDSDNYHYQLEKGYYYMYLENCYEQYETLTSIFKNNPFIILSDNYLLFENNDNLTMDLSNLSDKSTFQNTKIYQLNYPLFQETIKLLQKEQLNYTINQNMLQGTINTDGGLLMITIPYEKGINVYLDNQKVKPDIALDTFIAIPLNKGNHTIQIQYRQPGLILGSSVSIITILISGIYVIHKKFIKPRKKVFQ